MQIEGKVFAITGAGNGIAREVTLQLLGHGARVAALDINADGLDDLRMLAGSTADQLSTHIVNVVDRDAALSLPAQIIAEHGQVDGLLNIAGIIQPFVKVNDLPFDAIYRVVDVNFYGVINTVKAFLPELLQRPEAYLLNVSSMGGFAPVPGQTIYGATKAAVKLFTEGLHSELTGTNVHVTAIYPGAINTNIAANSGIANPGGQTAESSSFKTTPVDIAASTIIGAMRKNKYKAFIGSDAKMMDRLTRLMPERAAAIIYKQMASLLA